MKCRKCGREVVLPFRCPYCGNYFCSEHRLPENHNCPKIERARPPQQESSPFVRQRRELVIGQRQKSSIYPLTRSSIDSSGTFQFSQKEIKHLMVGTILVLGVGISFVIQDFSALTRIGLSLSLAATFTASFLIHEIAHKFSAQHYGLRAEFRLTLIGSFLTLFSIFFPFFKIIAPGAVMMAGAISKEKAGKTALAGPLTNITLSIIFIAIAVTLQSPIADWGAWINAFIALFNLIPFGIMDGWKVFRWNRAVWASSFISSISLAIFCFSYILV